MQRPHLVDDILGLIGKTPLVRINRVAPDRERAAAIWGKCEMMNPGGSVKDRIALAMIEAAERAGTIIPGRSTLVEPTSGNTGIGLALVCAVKGYRLLLTMPESMSLERRNLLKAYGAEIVLTPEDRTMEGAVSLARELCRKPDHFMLQQFENPANPATHVASTGPEILEQMAGLSIDGFVAGVGTGGTVSGVGKVLREYNPEITIVAVEPDSSAVLSGEDPGPHKIQGIGAGFVPKVLDTEIFDRVARIYDRDAWVMRQRLAQEEGLLVGISAGASMCAAVELARELGPGKNVVTVLCDTGERYFSLDAYFEDP
ncbi:cysteine synthase A [Pseudenhygromyxa sp. WMMC2535]|uniref:cysteine synthase A n=1 Tax=Pseudenhygromyxa sp. WMMC2535 TaxID=2712867 RepID=UPI0015557E13|nr:cysteine synthase A [Pseudenhygromyxa sp. WMMC2535]NVB41867.1 cysteine synthase A [Pseudenhygromyxa sp. WMMC2535]